MAHSDMTDSDPQDTRPPGVEPTPEDAERDGTGAAAAVDSGTGVASEVSGGLGGGMKTGAGVPPSAQDLPEADGSPGA